MKVYVWPLPKEHPGEQDITCVVPVLMNCGFEEMVKEDPILEVIAREYPHLPSPAFPYGPHNREGIQWEVRDGKRNPPQIGEMLRMGCGGTGISQYGPITEILEILYLP